MSDNLFSSSWHRVADLRPKVKDQAEILRQTYRGDIWYLIYDPVVGKQNRISVPAYRFMSLLEGFTTVNEAWKKAADFLSDDLPTQDEIIQLLSSLHQSDLLTSDRAPDFLELNERHKTFVKGERLKRFLNPMALRFKLIDPETILQVLEPFAKAIFSKAAFWLWIIVVVTGLTVLGTHWSEFTEGMSDRVLAVDNLLIMLFVFPVIKVFHEMGHALAVKKWGGEVHDMGVMLLVFMPVPYVDASSSWAFKSKYHRMLVGSAGMLVEVFVASVAIVLWALLEPGLVRSLFYNVVFIAGVTTILFNANPLLKFDGYYIFMDWLEVPNLASKANRYFAYLCKRFLIGVPVSDENWGDSTECRWFVFYAIASFFYRIFLSLTIAIFVAGEFFVVGVLLAIWALSMSIVMPIAKMLKSMFLGTELRRYRARAVNVFVIVCGLVIAILFVLPAPYFTVVEGVVWIPEKDHLRADSPGFVSNLVVQSGKTVQQGQLLLRLSDPELEARHKVLTAREKMFAARYRAERSKDQIEARVVKHEWQVVKKELENSLRKLNKLDILAEVDGIFFLSDAKDLVGRYVEKGQLIGYVTSRTDTVIRTAVQQRDVGIVRGRSEDIRVRFSSDIFDEKAANLIREVPGATNKLPSLALTQIGGGELAVNPDDKKRISSYQQVFLFDLLVREQSGVNWLGEKVYVRINHGFAPLYEQWSRYLTQLFLRLSDF